MSVISDAKELALLIKKIGDVDLERRIVNLQAEIIELTQQRNEISSTCEELTRRLDRRARMQFKAPVYYAEGDPIPMCPVCWERDEKCVHLSGPHHRDGSTEYDCNVCNQTIYPQTSSRSMLDYQEPEATYGGDDNLI